MTYVITELCASMKDTSCVEVCPVDCIHPTPEEEGFDTAAQLYIDPEECIDCDACVAGCPVSAIFDEGSVPGEYGTAIAANADYFKAPSSN
jgi:ferredoxin